MSARRAPLRLTIARWSGRGLAVAASLAAVAVAGLALVALRSAHHHVTSAGGPGAFHALTPEQYAFAVGGDFDPSLHSGVVLYEGEQVLRKQCMARRGFRYFIDPPPPGGLPGLPSASVVPSTFFPEPTLTAYPERQLLALREQQGFGIYLGPRGSHAGPEANDRYTGSLRPAQRTLWESAWMGPGGCFGAAQSELYGSRRAAEMELTVPGLVSDYLDSVVYGHYILYGQYAEYPEIARRAHALVSARSRCMRQATGHYWATEDALLGWLSGPSFQPGPGLRRLEIHDAAADTRCSYSTGQAQTFAADFVRIAEHLPRPIESQLSFLLAHRNAWVARATMILDRAGVGVPVPIGSPNLP
jgi:hypothetical protein